MTPRREIDEELGQHIERLAQHIKETEGLDTQSAQLEANRRFGDRGKIAERCAEPQEKSAFKSRGKRFGFVFNEIRFAIRNAIKNPGFAAVTIITLSLAIGVTTAIYSVFQGVLLRPLPFADPEQLVELGEFNPLEGVIPGGGGVSRSAFADWKERQTSFSGITAWEWDTSILDNDGEVVSLGTARTDIDLFRVLGITPVIGRFFEEGDAVAGQQPGVVVLSFDLWRDRFGADPGVLGTSIMLDGIPREILGVMQPEDKAPGHTAKLWLPKEYRRGIRWDRHRRDAIVYGRLNLGVTAEQANADLDLVASGLEEEFPDINENWRVWSAPLAERVIGDSRPTITVAFAAVGLLLVVACVNIANLFLARAAGRQREIAVRIALGATTGQVAIQLLAESLVLSLSGALVGFLAASPMLNGLIALQPDIIPRSGEIALDLNALLFAVGVSVVAGVLFGLAPLRGAFAEPAGMAIGGTRSVSAGRKENRIGNSLVVLQMVLTVVLLSGGALLGRSMWALSRVDPGFQAEGRVAARMFLDGSRYSNTQQLTTYMEGLLEKVASLPGVVSAGASTALPMDPLGTNYDLPVRLQGVVDPDNQLPQSDFRLVTPEYFNSLGIRVVSGVDLSGVDLSNRKQSVVVNQTMARQLWGGDDPIGASVSTPIHDWTDVQVVGVVEDTHYYGLGNDPKPEMYASLLDWPTTVFTVVAEVGGSAELSVESMRRGLLEVDGSQPAHSVVVVESLVSGSVAAQRFYAVVLGVFSVVALVLSLAGVYGVVSYWVNRRTREIGVRLALGADRKKVLSLVLGRGFMVASAGATLGFFLSLGATRTIKSVLFSVDGFDPVSMLGVPMVLVVTAVGACLVPAVKAMMVDPVESLKEE